MRERCLVAAAMCTDLQQLPENGVRRFWRNARRILMLGHLSGGGECDACCRDWALPREPAHGTAKSNRPGATLGEAATLLATSAAIYLLVAILIGILTRGA